MTQGASIVYIQKLLVTLISLVPVVFDIVAVRLYVEMSQFLWRNISLQVDASRLDTFGEKSLGLLLEYFGMIWFSELTLADILYLIL